ncbi:oligoendopeptidase F family protein [Parvularcula bermudensis]|uniref:oligoendopeptidase F family protein n=1 Tax=Parvularcula bermudensis TaxID=208216 RepID=UPI0011D249E2|nr:oligoendopeptidase F family protein [Parvularcula bermudensis]
MEVRVLSTAPFPLRTRLRLLERGCGSGSVLSVAFVNGEVQASAATAKARNFDNTLHYFLSGDTIPEAVYPPLVEIDYTFPLDAPAE